jgi:sulfopyruvate decarboxylase alpha subunit
VRNIADPLAAEPLSLSGTGRAWPSVEERSQAIIAALEEIRPDMILTIPSSTLKHVLAAFEGRADIPVVPLTREEEGIGIAAGMVLGGGRPVLVIQDNGLGNSLTALATFPQAYHIPLLILVSQRGGLGEYNSMIHTFCEHVEDIVRAAGLRAFSLDGRIPAEQWRTAIVKAFEYAQITHRPVLVLCNLMGF